MKRYLWLFWLFLTLGIASYYLYIILESDDKQDLIIGAPTHGHFQIEMSCATCHTNAFGGPELIQESCEACHSDELKKARDSHPKKKFNDPRNASQLAKLDARYCISCHTEHQKEQTRPMGVTLPDDYCFHCHQEIGNERASHKGLAFDSCATAGCHNYHDNRALYEDFLVDNAGGHWLKEHARITKANFAKNKAEAETMPPKLEFKKIMGAHPGITEHWQRTDHAKANVSCVDCHNDGLKWVQNPGLEQCSNCHKGETDGFLKGKHGMRLAEGLDTLDLSSSSLTFKQGASAHQGCTSCHKPHENDAAFSSTQACLNCHSDQHSLAFDQSPHAQLKHKAERGEISNEETVSCATCHLPRHSKKEGGIEIVTVEHNQNENLRPNEKMIRPVCMQCHSIEFSIDALADRELIKNNFSGLPAEHIPSVDWATERVEDKN